MRGESNEALERTGEVTRRPQVLGQFGGAWGSSGGWVVAGPLSLTLCLNINVHP